MLQARALVSSLFWTFRKSHSGLKTNLHIQRELNVAQEIEMRKAEL